MSDTPQHPRPLVWVVGDAMIDETLPAAATRFAQEDPAEASAALVFCDHAKGAVGTAEDMAAWVAGA